MFDYHHYSLFPGIVYTIPLSWTIFSYKMVQSSGIIYLTPNNPMQPLAALTGTLHNVHLIFNFEGILLQKIHSTYLNIFFSHFEYKRSKSWKIFYWEYLLGASLKSSDYYWSVAVVRKQSVRVLINSTLRDQRNESSTLTAQLFFKFVYSSVTARGLEVVFLQNKSSTLTSQFFLNIFLIVLLQHGAWK